MFVIENNTLSVRQEQISCMQNSCWYRAIIVGLACSMISQLSRIKAAFIQTLSTFIEKEKIKKNQ